MSGWIKIDKALVESLRFKRVVRVLRNALRGVTVTSGTEISYAHVENIVLGALFKLWSYADTHIDENDVLEATLDEIDEIVGCNGFAAALPADWLQVIDAEHVKLPDFLGHNGGSARTRKGGAKRQAAYRSRQKARNVTESNALRDATRPDQTRLDQKEEKVPSEPLSAAPTEAGEPAPRETPDHVGEAVARVFRHWREVHGHPRAQLDAKRRKLIRAALANYSEADLCLAISGYRNSPHHMGQNDRATVYDDIGLMLRDASHIDAGLRFSAAPPRTDLSAQTRRIIDQTADWQPPEVRHAAN